MTHTDIHQVEARDTGNTITQSETKVGKGTCDSDKLRKTLCSGRTGVRKR